jgi:hypothetical protein
LVRAELAYLSACSVAKNGSPELVDEAIHLASALFSFGFPNVVGPLWELLDKSALQVTGGFYERLAGSLFEAGSDRRGGALPQRAVADALHEATLARLQGYKEMLDFASWASIVHIGI